LAGDKAIQIEDAIGGVSAFSRVQKGGPMDLHLTIEELNRLKQILAMGNAAFAHDAVTEKLVRLGYAKDAGDRAYELTEKGTLAAKDFVKAGES
jgi:hypothetical protein